MITGPRASIKKARKLRSEMSLPETLLWRELPKRSGGFKFRRQHPAGNYVLDFHCAKVRLAIELDGRAHDSPARVLSDRRRSEFLRSQGVSTTRIPAKLVLDDMEAVVRRVVEICTQRMEYSMGPLHQPAAGPPPRSGEDL